LRAPPRSPSSRRGARRRRRVQRELDLVVDDYRHAELAREAHNGSGLHLTSCFAPVLQQRDAAFEREAQLALDVATSA